MKKILALSLLAVLFAGCSHNHKKWHAKKMARKVAKFQSMDKNGNGKVNKKEWKSYINDKFKKLDTNKDNQVSEEEFLSFYKSKCWKCGAKKCSKCGSKKCDGKSCSLKAHKCTGKSCKICKKKS